MYVVRAYMNTTYNSVYPYYLSIVVVKSCIRRKSETPLVCCEEEETHCTAGCWLLGDTSRTLCAVCVCTVCITYYCQGSVATVFFRLGVVYPGKNIRSLTFSLSYSLCSFPSLSHFFTIDFKNSKDSLPFSHHLTRNDFERSLSLSLGRLGFAVSSFVCHRLSLH